MQNALLSVVFVVILANTALSQHNEYIEITEKDITEYPEITSDKISVFGMHLGMNPDDVYLSLINNKNLNYYVDQMHMTNDVRIYVYDKDEFGKDKNCILYLIWENRQIELSSISFFEDFDSYLIGNTKKLLGFDAIDADSDLSKDFLGIPDHDFVTLNIPSNRIKHRTYFYKSKGLSVTFKENADEQSVIFTICLNN
jgi:hypothetical protein